MTAILPLILIFIGLAQIGLGYIGLEDWLGSGWAFAALMLAFIGRIIFPLTLGSFLAMTNVYGFSWLIGLIVAVPGLLLIAPAMVSDVLSKVFRK